MVFYKYESEFPENIGLKKENWFSNFASILIVSVCFCCDCINIKIAATEAVNHKHIVGDVLSLCSLFKNPPPKFGHRNVSYVDSCVIVRIELTRSSVNLMIFHLIIFFYSSLYDFETLVIYFLTFLSL